MNIMARCYYDGPRKRDGSLCSNCVVTVKETVEYEWNKSVSVFAL